MKLIMEGSIVLQCFCTRSIHWQFSVKTGWNS